MPRREIADVELGPRKPCYLGFLPFQEEAIGYPALVEYFDAA